MVRNKEISSQSLGKFSLGGDQDDLHVRDEKTTAFWMPCQVAKHQSALVLPHLILAFNRDSCVFLEDRVSPESRLLVQMPSKAHQVLS